MAKTGDETGISHASRDEGGQKECDQERQLRRIHARQELQAALANLAKITRATRQGSDDGNHAASLSEGSAPALAAVTPGEEE